MMTALSDYLEDALLQHVLDTWALYLALFTTATTDSGGGTEVVGYTRPLVVFSTPAGGLASNTGFIILTNTPAAVVTHVAIKDALTGGHHMFHGPLQEPKVLEAAGTTSFAPGDFVIGLQ